MKIAVFGRTKILYDTIERLINAGHNIVVIGTCRAAPEYEIRENDFKQKAEELQVDYFDTANIGDPSVIKLLKASGAELAVSVNWVTIIKKNILDIFRYGVLNAHCGDLPRYRGNACPNWAIINNEKEFGVSVHFMTEELDAGNIIIKEHYPIDKETNVTDIYEIAEREIPELFCKAVNKIQNGYMGEQQSRNPKEVLRCYPRIPSDSIIDWNLSCEEILREVRAFSSPFEGAYTFYGDVKIHIMHCEKKDYDFPCCVCPGQIIMVDKNSGRVEIAAKDGVIVVDRIIVNKDEIPAADILRSTRIRLNYNLMDEIYFLRKQVSKLEEQIDAFKLADNINF